MSSTLQSSQAICAANEKRSCCWKGVFRNSWPYARSAELICRSFDLSRLIDELVESCWTDAQARAMAASGLINSGHSTPQGPSMDQRRPSFVEIVADVADRDQVRGIGSTEKWVTLNQFQGWWVKSDKSGIRRILINLIGNSLKFTTVRFQHHFSSKSDQECTTTERIRPRNIARPCTRSRLQQVQYRALSL